MDQQYFSDMFAFARLVATRVDLLYILVLYLSEKEMMNTEDIQLLLTIVRNSPVLTKSAKVYRSMPVKNPLHSLGPWIQEPNGHVNFNISFSTVKGIALGFAEREDHYPMCCLESYCVQPGVRVFSPIFMARHLAEQWKEIQRYARENEKYPLPDRRGSNSDILRTLDADQEVMITDASIEAGDYQIDESDARKVLTRKGILKHAPEKNIQFETTRHYTKAAPMVSERTKSIKKIANKRLD